jgi:preprotein translocase subunit SecE
MGKEKKETTKKNNKANNEKVLAKKKVSKKEKKNRVSIFKAIVNFFKGVKSEMGKVTWPSKKEMIKYTVATVVFIVFFALFFYGIILVLGLLKDLIVIL